MRLKSLVLSSLFFVSTSARLQHRHRNGLTQVHPSRDLVDLCVSLDADIIVDVLALLGVGVEANVCLCLQASWFFTSFFIAHLVQDLDLFLNATLTANVDLLGLDTIDTVRNYLSAQFAPPDRKSVV